MVSTKIRMTQTAQMGPSIFQMPRGAGGVSDAGLFPVVFEFMMRFYSAGDLVERPVDGVDPFAHEPCIGL